MRATLDAGASFSPANSLLYFQSTGAGRALDALEAITTHVHFGSNWDMTSSGNAYVELISGEAFAPYGPIAKYTSGLGSETLLQGGAPGPHGGVANVLYYEQVTNRAGLERWLLLHNRPDGHLDGFALYTARPPQIGVDAVSNSAWLLAFSMPTLRAAIETHESGHASLLDDTAARTAVSSVNAAHAAIVGYTRGDLLHEMLATHEFPVDFGSPNETVQLTKALGLGDMGFAIGANTTGYWLRATPTLAAGGYRPGPTFTPSLLSQIPKNTIVYVGIADGAAQWPGIDRVLATYVGGNSDPNPSTANPNPAGVQSLLAGYLRVDPSDVARIGGEQEWFYGDSVGAAFRPTNMAEAQAALDHIVDAPEARALGYRTGRDGSVLWLHGHWSASAQSAAVAGPAPATLLARAGVTRPISWVVAVDVAPLVHLVEMQPKEQGQPFDSVDGVVITTSPDTSTQYNLDVYVDIAH